MDEPLHFVEHNTLTSLSANDKQTAIAALENGSVVFFPNYFFHPSATQEKSLFSETILDGKHKNISYDYRQRVLGGLNRQLTASDNKQLQIFMQAFAEFAYQTVSETFPQYAEALRWGRTSYRPAKIEGRVSSKRKDDTRLHVDAFPSTPVNGQRILRIFCNINPYNEPRVWHIGEPFAKVISRFSRKIPAYNAALANLLKLIKATKTRRSAYDHYQLHLHDAMKLDDHYQNEVEKHRFDFPANSTWVVFTDQVSHAALSGQYVLEQTFYLPIQAMQNAELSPWRYWAREKADVTA